MSSILNFSGKNHFLSNFYPSIVEMDGVSYPTVEHAYQAAKTLDREEREIIRTATTPGMAKKLGKHANVRDGWISQGLREKVMATLVWQKFSKHQDLANKLLETGEEELIEGNWWGDTFWGVCQGEGQNILGKILMETRRQLRRMHEHSSAGSVHQEISNG